MNRHVAIVGLAGLALTGAATGCAHRTSSSTSSIMPSAAVRLEPAVPSGSWYGTVVGRESGDAKGDELGAADLTLTPDGQFTLGQTFSSMQGVNSMRATGTARTTPRGRIILDGIIAVPEARKGEPFVATLEPRRDALYGTTDVLYRGGKVGTIIELGRRS